MYICLRIQVGLSFCIVYCVYIDIFNECGVFRLLALIYVYAC